MAGTQRNRDVTYGHVLLGKQLPFPSFGGGTSPISPAEWPASFCRRLSSVKPPLFLTDRHFKAVNNLGVALLSQGKLKEVRSYPWRSLYADAILTIGYTGHRSP